MTIPWEKVHVFISSTFNDMHAERDYLVKQVFPELREWCEKRKLRLVDIDLRWGVTEQDALHNKNVVKVCLDRIDDCRPFFLCFLGQRRGWVPGESDISAATFEEFPGLKAYAGEASVTEMEILHALVDPLHRGAVRDPKKSSEFYEPSSYAFFYLRDGSYLSQLPHDPLQLRQIYTNEGIENKEVRKQQDAQLRQWREEKIPATRRPARAYQARWDAHLVTPELLLPLVCPSSEPANIQRWKEQWAKAGVEVVGDDLEISPNQEKKARLFNQKLTTGRLTDFQSKNQPLSRVILQDLQAAIYGRYPEHVEIGEQTDLQKEIDQQEQFLFISSEGFIRREGDFDALNAYVEGEASQLFALTAPGGVGKSTLLANWIDQYRNRKIGKNDQSIHFRFIGQSDLSTTVYSLLSLLLREIKEISGKFNDAIPDDSQKLRQELPKLLEAASRRSKTIIVVDALNQLETGLSDLSWLPFQLPKNVKMIVSFKRGTPEAEEVFQRMQEQVLLSDAKPFIDLDDRRKLVKAYLSQYLKDLDERHLEALITSAGAENPLFLKVVLSELRVFGAFANLGEKIHLDFGETPVTAFQGVLKRLENDPACSPIHPAKAVPYLFGLLAHARQGLSAEELTGLFIQGLGMKDDKSSRRAASDSLHLYLRQVRPFMAYRDGSFDFFFESFRLAAQERYVGEELPKRPLKEWHRLLAEYFIAQPLMVEKDGSAIPNRHKLVEQVYQSALGDKGQELVETLTNYRFLETKIGSINVQALLDDFEIVSTVPVSMGADSKDELSLVKSTIRLAASILAQDRHQLAAQLIGRLGKLETPGIKSLLAQAHKKEDSIWLLPITSDLISPGGPLELSLPGFSKVGAITPDGFRLVAEENEHERLAVVDAKHGNKLYSLNIPMGKVTPDGARAISTVQPHFSSQLTITDLLSRKPTASFEHKNSVRGMAIAPNGCFTISHAASGSIIKMWTLSDGKEIRVFKHPGREATGFDVLSNGEKLVSYSSEKICIWDLKDGRLVSEWQAPESEQIYCVFITADEQKLVIRLIKSTGPYSSDIRVIVWDLALEKIGFTLRHLQSEPGVFINLVSPDRVYAIEESGNLVNLVTNEVLPIHVPDAWQAACTFTPQGCLVINAGKEFRLWETGNTREKLVISNPDSEFIHVIGTKDNKHILTSSKNGNVSLWRVEDGKEEYPPITINSIHSLAITPDLQRVITLTSDLNCAVWELTSSRELWSGKLGQSVRPTDVKVSQNGKFALFSFSYESYGGMPFRVLDLINLQFRDFIADATSSGSLIAKDAGCRKIIINSKPSTTFSVWDLGKEAKEASLSGHNSELNALAISPDGRWAVSASPFFEYVVRDANTGQAIYSMLREDQGGYETLKALSLDGTQAITGNEIIDLRTGRSVRSLPGLIWSNEVLTPDGWMGVSSTKVARDSHVTIWNMQNFEVVKEFQVLDTGMLVAGALSQDGWVGAFLNTSSKAELWNMETGKIIGTIPDPIVNRMGVVHLPLNYNGKWALSESYGGEIKLWNLEKLRPEENKGRDAVDPVTALIPINNTGKLFALHEKSNHQFWDDQTGIVSSTSDIKINPYSNITLGNQGTTSRLVLQHEEEIIGLDLLEKAVVQTPSSFALLTPDRSRAILHSKEKNLIVRDVAARKNVWEIPITNKTNVYAISPDGKKIVIAAGKKAEIRDLQSGKLLSTLEDKVIFSDITVLSFSPDGKLIIAGHYSHLTMWSMDTGQVQSAFEVSRPGITTDIAFIWNIKVTPDQRKIVSISGTSNYSCIVVWDFSSGRHLLMIKETGYPFNEPQYFSLLSLSADGQLCIACSRRTMYLIDLRNDKVIRTFSTEAERITSCAFIPDSKRIAYGCESGKIYFLEIENYP